MIKIVEDETGDEETLVLDPVPIAYQRAIVCRGMLIEGDLAKEVGSGCSSARHQTGTMEFMAIEVLQYAVHTDRYDLESLFYVLLWMCGRRSWERGFLCKSANRLAENILNWWYTHSLEAIAERKEHAMSPIGFTELLNEFPPAFQQVTPLCEELRRLLFPVSREGVLLVGRPPGPPEELYDSILDAFDEAIDEFRTTERAGTKPVGVSNTVEASAAPNMKQSVV